MRRNELKHWLDKQKSRLASKVEKMMMKCICSGEHLIADEAIPSSESLATRDYSASGYSSRTADIDVKVDTSNIEEAESSLRESGFLNYEEARALLGRLEYQKGNVEAALHVFEGIDVAAVFPRIKVAVVRRIEHTKHHSRSDNSPLMSMHAVTLLIEANFLKAKSLQALGRYTEAAYSCKVILDTFESAAPDGLPEALSSYVKLLETVNKAVELLPELYQRANLFQDAVLAYRRALLYHWNLDVRTRTKIEKSFATFLLYSAHDASPPNLRSQMEDSFIPRNNIEEAILLLLLILKKITLKKIEWDPSILDHLSFALSIACECGSLALQIEELNQGTVEEEEKHTSLALCYLAEDENMVALNLLRNMLNNREAVNLDFELLLASKICVEEYDLVQEGIRYVQKLLARPEKCRYSCSITHHLLGLAYSTQSRGVSTEIQRSLMQSQALEEFETASRMVQGNNSCILFSLSIENAEQRKLESALYYAKQVLKLEAGANVKSWILFARILSAQRRYNDSENIVDAALDEAGKWDQGELLRMKAKLQIAQGRLREATETYTRLLALLQVHRKSNRAPEKHSREKTHVMSLEMETWHDLANVYSSLSQWKDAEVCLSKSEAINQHSASRLHSEGLLYEAKGLQTEALKSFKKALDIEPNHVPSLISIAVILLQMNSQSLPVAKSFLTDALKLERTNHRAWYNLGLLYKRENNCALAQAAECFEAAALLEETEPVEPFR